MNGVLRPGGTLTNTRQMRRLEGGARRMGTVGGGGSIGQEREMEAGESRSSTVILS